MLSWFAKPLAVGSIAPPFMAPDQDGTVFILNQHRNKHVILVFYPGDDTMVCTKQLCELRDRWDLIRAAGGYVLGVNPAADASHTAFRQKHRLPFPLLVDHGKRVAKLYRCDGPIVRRTVYVVDRVGRIAYAQRGKPSVEEILKVLPSAAPGPAAPSM
jgi:peroxiredoxin Q/BCP